MKRDGALGRALDNVLLPQGFVRTKSRWNRRGGVWTDVVSVHRSKGEDRFTVELGVYKEEVHRLLWGRVARRPVDTVDCVVSVRLGALAKERDLWWDWEDMSAQDEIVAMLQSCGLGFIDRMHDAKCFKEELAATARRSPYPPPSIALAIMRFLDGDRSGAIEALGALRGKCRSEPWRGGIDEVVGRLKAL